MFCPWHNSESSALQGIRTRKIWKKLGTLSSLYIPTLSQKQMRTAVSMQLDKIISQGADTVCTQAGLGLILFLIAGITMQRTRENSKRPQTTKKAEEFRPKERDFSCQKLPDACTGPSCCFWTPAGGTHSCLGPTMSSRSTAPFHSLLSSVCCGLGSQLVLH